MKQDYCDYCGEVIHNYHNIKKGLDIDLAINYRIMKPTINRFKSKILNWIIVFGIVPYLDWNRNWCFCNQQHKDKFAKRIGLKIQIKKKRGKQNEPNTTRTNIRRT